MKNTHTIATLCFLLLLLLAGTTRAAFPIKKEVVKHATSTPSQVQFSSQSSAYADESNRINAIHTETATTKKHSFFSKLMNHAAAAASGVSQVVYIILAILPLGWLGIGLNEDWKGNHWWIALLLYFCFWLPGIVYSFIMMPNYY